MPHDAKGNLIQPGDKVFIPATVVNVFQTEGNQFCNCDVELEHPMPPYAEKVRYSALNTQQVEKAQPIREALLNATWILDHCKTTGDEVSDTALKACRIRLETALESFKE